MNYCVRTAINDESSQRRVVDGSDRTADVEHAFLARRDEARSCAVRILSALEVARRNTIDTHRHRRREVSQS